ncbi:MULTISPECIES: hypothetical protein [unclassified Streptomyces]
MAKKKNKKSRPKGEHQDCGQRDRAYRTARWLGPIYAAYRAVRDLLV